MKCNNSFVLIVFGKINVKTTMFMTRNGLEKLMFDWLGKELSSKKLYDLLGKEMGWWLKLW